MVVLVRLSVPVEVIWLERLVSEMTYNVLTGTLNPINSLLGWDGNENEVVWKPTTCGDGERLCRFRVERGMDCAGIG